MVCHVLLIESSAGLVLVDSGLGLGDVRDARERLGAGFCHVVRPRLLEEETAYRRIEALGLSPSDVRHVVLTHLDLDHAGGMSDFPAATVHVMQAEHGAAMHPRLLGERHRYRQAHWAHGPRFATYTPSGERWKGFERVRRLEGLPPEILLIPLTGHTRGHAGVAVDTGAGWLLHAGDAYFHHDQLAAERPRCPAALSLFQRVVAVDRPKMRENQARLRELALGDREVRIFSAHDPLELARCVDAEAPSERPASADRSLS